MHINLEHAQKAIETARKKAVSLKTQECIAVVDSGANLKAFPAPVGSPHSGIQTANLEGEGMVKKFKVGDHVTWNSEAGHVSGRIIKIHKKDVEYKGYTRHATADDPHYEIKSDKTEHVAMHKGSALKKKD